MRSDAYLKTFHAFREWVETHARFSVEATKCIGSILYRKVFPPRKIDNTEFTERKIDNTDFTERHRRQLKLFEADHDRDQAMRTTIGGEEFEAIGLLERAILIQYGLKKNAYVIDVGCGSGRLALPLSKYLSGKYLGIDVGSGPGRICSHACSGVKLAI